MTESYISVACLFEIMPTFGALKAKLRFAVVDLSVLGRIMIVNDLLNFCSGYFVLVEVVAADDGRCKYQGGH